jgi:predicted NBD/HSP70 family sugar kinase
MDTKPLRSADIRARNEKLVLSIIRRRSGISQSEVAQETGLKPPTVFRIFQVLEEQGFILGCDGDSSRGAGSDGGDVAERSGERKGRRPSYFCVKPEALYVVGVDFWARSASAVVVDFGGNPVYRQVVDLSDHNGAEEILRRLNALIGDAISSSGVARDRLLGIGVGAPGMVDTQSGVVLRYPRIASMDGFPLRERLESEFGVPVHVHNNAAVIALSEYRYGSVRGRRSVLTLVLRAGVGGAFIQDGQLFVNHHRTALEVGHISVDPAGPECRCGRRGCLETYLSEGVLRREADAESAEEYFSLLEDGEERAVSPLQRASEKLVSAVYSLLNTLNPEAILIVSRSQALSEALCDAVREALSEVPSFASAAERHIVPHEYDPVIAGQGAADLVFDSFFTTVGG